MVRFSGSIHASNALSLAVLTDRRRSFSFYFFCLSVVLPSLVGGCTSLPAPSTTHDRQVALVVLDADDVYVSAPTRREEGRDEHRVARPDSGAGRSVTLSSQPIELTSAAVIPVASATSDAQRNAKLPITRSPALPEVTPPDEPVSEPPLADVLWKPAVKPWQKRYLAKEHMMPQGPVGGSYGFMLKIHQSKEGTRGGIGSIGGSGCGCN